MLSLCLVAAGIRNHRGLRRWAEREVNLWRSPALLESPDPKYLTHSLGSGRILIVRFRYRLSSITILLCYAPTETFDILEEDFFHEQLHAVQGRLPKVDNFVIVT